MAAEKKEPSDAMTLRDFFGYKKDEKLKDFMAELKSLTDEDRKQLVGGIKDGTLNY